MSDGHVKTPCQVISEVKIWHLLTQFLLPDCACRLMDSSGGQEQFRASHAVLTRFGTMQQLQAFLRLPPCSQLLKTAEDPCFASALSFSYSILPPNASRSSAPQRNLL